jgi:hypothetical protein
MSTTFGSMVEEVLSLLHGHTTDVPAAATLSAAIDADDLSLTLDFGDTPWAGRPNGLVEVDDELVAISSYNSTNGVATVPPWGRGQRGTTAASHLINSKVTVRPRYPRARVKQTINSVIRESCPPLFAAVDLDPFDTGALVDIGYTLPTNTIRVIRVEATDSLLDDDFAVRRKLRSWDVRNIAGTQLLEIPRDEAYQTIVVTIAAEPTALVNDSDLFTVSGLPESCAGMAVFGTIARLILGIELAKQQSTTVEANARNDKVQSGSATTVSRYYQALYTQRLEYERDHLQQLYPLQLLRRG